MFGINLIPNSEKSTPPNMTKIDLWKTELKEAIKDTTDLELVLKRKIPKTPYPVFIPRRLAEKIYQGGPSSALWKQFVPHALENKNNGMIDPIGDHEYSKPGRIVHRYKNRLLFFPTPVCPINCRYCFRKNELANPDELFEGRLKETVSYLYDNPEVNEVILSGGDPLILNDEKLENIFRAFSQIPSVKYLRIHSRTPIIIPSRITIEFSELLKKYRKSFHHLIIAVHANHFDEIDDDVSLALTRLKNSGVELLSQSVLLKEVNDDTSTLKKLFNSLSDLGVRPYYLHHPDRVKGAMHFYLSLTEGRMLYHSLRNELPGWMLPQYVIDIPGGEGKVPAFNPETFDFSGALLNKHGVTIEVDPLG